jgi:hypothetical protein
MNVMNFDSEKAFEYENGFYLTSDISRIGKMMAHFELYKMISNLPGDIVETGVFKGASFIRWLTYRNLLENENSRAVIGFDSFEYFPKTEYLLDKTYRENFINSAGDHSIQISELEEVCKHKHLRNFNLIKGNINETFPDYFNKNPHTKIALLHIDTDVYEPAKTALEIAWPRLVKGGIIILDDYGTFPGETKAVDDFFRDKNVRIKKLSISHKIPAYIVKETF